MWDLILLSCCLFFLIELLDRISDVRDVRDVRDANNSCVVECCNDLTSLNQCRTY